MALERYIKGRKSKRYIRKLIDEEAAVKSLLDKFNISRQAQLVRAVPLLWRAD
ncbi:MAG: hypothetical protein H6559_25915 [Lewinellaceae bacterium]|nr:hypothetical protein [Lewinellaceae bacterium]